MDFRRQLLVGQSASLLATILTAVVAIVSINAMTRSADQVATELATDISSLDQLRLDAERLVSTSRAYLLSGDDAHKTRFRTLELQFESTLDRLSSERAETSTVEHAARAYVDAVRQAAEQRLLTNDPKAIAEVFDHELTPKRAAFERELEATAGHERADIARARARARRLASRTQLTVAVSSVLALALGIGLSVLFTRTLTRQLRKIDEATAAARTAATSREELVNIVSHDLRNPIHTIVLGVSLLRQTTPKGGSEERTVDRIANAAARVTRLIEDLSDRASIEKGEFALRRDRHDAVAIVRDAIELFQSIAAEQGIALRSETSGSIAIYVDRDRILQVFSNLIGNALRFVEPGGAVTVRVAASDRETRFAVVDTGSGIPSDQVPHVFERHYQGERRSEGTLGLGLYICRLLVEQHHGRIGVDSAPGSGSTFWFTLPAGPRYLT